MQEATKSEREGKDFRIGDPIIVYISEFRYKH